MLACFFAGSSLNWQNYFHEEELNSHFTLGIDNLLDTVSQSHHHFLYSRR